MIDQMEFLSMLVAHSLVDAPVALVSYPYSPQRVWQHAKPFILAARRDAPATASTWSGSRACRIPALLRPCERSVSILFTC